MRSLARCGELLAACAPFAPALSDEQRGARDPHIVYIVRRGWIAVVVVIVVTIAATLNQALACDGPLRFAALVPFCVLWFEWCPLARLCVQWVRLERKGEYVDPETARFMPAAIVHTLLVTLLLWLSTFCITMKQSSADTCTDAFVNATLKANISMAANASAAYEYDVLR